jgi:hypothetical protein
MSIPTHLFKAFVASTVLVSASAAAAQAPTTQDLVGTWNVTLTSPQGTHPTTIAITEDGGKLAGTLTGLPGTTPLVVTTSESGVSLSFSVDYQGQPIPVVMTGKIAGNEIKGLVDYASGGASGDFQGTKAAVSTNGSNGAPGTNGSATSVAGRWAIASDGGSGWAFELTQDGTAVGGLLENSDRGISLPVKGTLEDGALSLAVSGEGASGSVKGTLENGALKGSYDLNGSSGSWSATRKP